MYPPTVVVLALALVSCGSRQVRSLETLLRLEQLDGDGDGGLGDLGSSSTFEDTAYDTDSEDNVSNSYPQQPKADVPLDGVYYRVTPPSDQDSQERTLVASPTSSTTGNSIIPEEEDASVEDQQVTDKIVGLAQPFIGGTSEDDLHDTAASRSRSLDHDPSSIDTLQSPSTVLETSLSTNYLYTSGTGSSGYFNDSYHHSTTSDISSDNSSSSSELDVSSSEDQSTTTNLPPLSLGPDDDVIAPKPTKPHLDESKISKAELLSLLIADKNLRLPIAILVDTCNDSLSYSKKVFDASLVPRSPLEVILMRYNATGKFFPVDDDDVPE